MLEYRKDKRSCTTDSPAIPETVSRRAVQPPSYSHSARSQAAGLARLNALSKSLSASSFDSPPPTTASEPSEAEKAEAERRAVLEDGRLVDEELQRYEAEGIMDEDNPEFADFGLLRYWQRREFTFPIFFRIALDVLRLDYAPRFGSLAASETLKSTWGKNVISLD
ncbi:hypothetical protein B0H17DRAFT_1218798 [Mycena rosella]|uniref:HAT C-terminal dimerisation domain-containing protein n=1 Tax=Mycena rosella TaxID=1033263 RepID=A0AAD7BM58_MYCRO|nr:hypothetical protein B0H17DRAFT_1218798 [Mycena rosella]